ncbi:MAG: arsenic transporter [Firmicutes bacterium]|nr:arsenic transporter [Bacillota bacterium]
MAFSKYRPFIALGSAALFVIIGILPLGKVFPSIDWNVIMMIAGTMGTVSLFIESKMPALMSDVLIAKMPNVKWVNVILALFAGIVSAFVDNVATVLMIAPVALVIAKKLNISPVSSIIAISVSSNLQGAATLVGDTTSIMLAGFADMDFLDFFWFRGKIGIFFAVEIGALLTMFILLRLFRKETQKIEAMERTKVTDYFPTVLLVGTVVLLILASFIPNKPAITNGIICMALMIIGVVRDCIKNKGFATFKKVFAEIDYFTLGLLIGLFVIIAGITEAGLIDAIADIFVRIAGDNLFVIYTLIVFASVIFSAFIDNIPYVATMLPVVGSISAMLGVEPYLLAFGLLIGATLGGNITPIGASANITGIGILRKNGFEVSTGEFMKISVPFTLTAVISGYLFIWLVWA